MSVAEVLLTARRWINLVPAVAYYRHTLATASTVCAPTLPDGAG
jgi:hypothetical protein